MLKQIGSARLVIYLSLLIVGTLVARYSHSIPFGVDAERALYDIRASVAAPVTDQDSRVIMITYQNSTLRLSGKRSPLDRTYLARALKRLDGMGAKSIGIDILFDSPQKEDDPGLIAQLKTMRTPTWVASVKSDPKAGPDDPNLMEPWQEAYLHQMLDQLKGSQSKPASVFMETDDDGVIRFWPRQKPDWGPRLVEAMAPGYRGFSDYQGAIRYRHPRAVDQKLYSELPIDLFATEDTPANAFVASLLAGAVKGRYVLIGADIPTIDQFSTPATIITRQKITGLESHANLLTQMLDGVRFKPIPSWALWLVAAASVITGGLGSASRLRIAVFIAFSAEIVIFAAIPYFLQAHNFDTQTYPALGSLIGWIVASGVVGAAARALTSDQRAFAQQALGKYIPPDIAKEILENPGKLVLSGERRDIYVTFTDLEGFTQLTHAMDPVPLATLLNNYLQILSDVVLQNGGTLDKFVGDAVIAFWGAPISRPDDADRAARAAIALYDAGENFRHAAPPGTPPVGCTRVGLHHGDAVVGNFGGEGRVAYTALGDAMNTAARLESANKQLGTTMLASAEALEHVTDRCFRNLGRITVKGRSTPIEIFEAAPKFPADLLERHNDAYARFDCGDLTALEELKSIAEGLPGDEAMANFIFRISSAGPGGSFVLNDK